MMKFDPWHLVWFILLLIAGALCTVGYLGPNWVLPCTDCDSGTYANFAQTAKDNRACGPLYYSNEAFDGAEIYPTFNDIPGDWWKSATVLAGIGIGLLGVGVIGAFVTMFAQSYQPMAHNIEVAGGILILVGLICFAVGLKDTKIDSANSGNGICKICGEKTSPFVLENCTIGDDFILIIVGVVIQCIAGCVGWNVNHRERANDQAPNPNRRWTRNTSPPPATNNAAYAPAVPDRKV